MSAVRNQVLVGDARELVLTLEPASVDMVLTSPPYFRLRDYAAVGQLGLESAVKEWVGQLAGLMQGVRRLLLPTGTLWLNLGDSYAVHPREGAARKSLLLGPERLALQLVADGWVLRNKVIWQKANPMPTSVSDRLACTWEVIYVFANQPSYFFDLDAVRVPHTSRRSQRQTQAAVTQRNRETWRGPNSGSTTGMRRLLQQGRVGHPLGKNVGDVWRIGSSSFRGGHHATFPLALAERAIRAGAPEARCARCRQPWRRAVLRSAGGTAARTALAPTCQCPSKPEPAVVLDPFFGAGTTAVAAERLRRDWLGIELNPSYAQLAERRIYEARAGPAVMAA